MRRAEAESSSPDRQYLLPWLLAAPSRLNNSAQFRFPLEGKSAKGDAMTELEGKSEKGVAMSEFLIGGLVGAAVVAALAVLL
jgi:hypothetical protein